MSPRTFVTRGTALLALALGIAACGETKIIPNNPNIQVVVTPPSATVAIGQTVSFVAQVTGTTAGQNTGVTWALSPSGSNVATLTTSGNTATVTGKTVGSVSVIATSAQDASKQAAVQVTVTDTAHGGGTPPSVSIQSITDNDGHNVDVTNVQGQINIALNVDVPAGTVVSSVNWLIDGKVVCKQSFASSKSAAGNVTTQSADAVTMSCQINTAAVDSTGKPVFANGTHTLSATLIGPSGTVQASTTQTLVFNNQNTLNAVVTTTKTAPGPNGFAWNGGNLTIVSTPALFNGGTVGRVVITLTSRTAPFTILATFTDSVAPFNVTFAGDSTIALPAGSIFATLPSGQIATPLAGITDSVAITITSVTTAGTQGPSTPAGGIVALANGTVLRFDNFAPTVTVAPVAPTSGWIGAAAISATATGANGFGMTAVDYGPTGVGTQGVNTVTYTVLAADTGSTTFKAVTKGTDIGDKAAGAEQFEIKACDALANCTTVPATTFKLGVDVEAPTIVFLANNKPSGSKMKTVGATDSIEVGFTDQGPSGFSTTTPVQSKILADTGAGLKVCAFGTGASCTPIMTSSLIAIPVVNPPNGEYMVYSGYVEDQAGNRSNVVMDTLLVDLAAPTAGSITGPTTLTGGASAVFLDSASDNLAVASIAGKIGYALGFGAFNKVLGSATTASWSRGAAFTFLKTTAASFTDPFFIRAIETPAALGTYILPSSFPSVIKDLVGNSTTTVNNPFTGVTAPTTNPFATTAATVTAAQVNSDTTAQTITARYTITGTAITTPVASQVLVYLVPVAGGDATLVATGTSPVISVDPSNTHGTFIYTLTPTATLTNKNGPYRVVAIFVTSGGVGLEVDNTLGS